MENRKIIEEETRLVLLNDENTEIGKITWSNVGENIFIIDHTYVDPAYCGQKLAAQLISEGVKKVRRENKKVYYFVHLQKIPRYFI